MSPCFVFLNQIKSVGQQYLLFICLPILVLQEHQEIQQTWGYAVAFSLPWPLRIWGQKPKDRLKVGVPLFRPHQWETEIFMCLECSGLPCLWSHLLFSHFLCPSAFAHHPTTSKIPLGSWVGGCHSTLSLPTALHGAIMPLSSLKTAAFFWEAHFNISPTPGNKTPKFLFSPWREEWDVRCSDS